MSGSECPTPTTAVEAVYPQRLNIKRKLDDYANGDEDAFVRHDSTRLQFFVRMMSEGNTLVLRANPHDSVQSIHQKIQSLTGIPITEQRLLYGGKQLQWDQTLSQCSIQNDAGLQLLARMRSTEHPRAWKVIDQMLSLLRLRLRKGDAYRPSSNFMLSKLMEFLTMAPRDNAERASRHLEIFLYSSAPAALVMLYVSPLKGNKESADESIRLFIDFSTNLRPKSLYSVCTPIALQFCKLLSGVVSYDDPLYNLCRSTLASMLEYIEHARVLRNGDRTKRVPFQEIFPFVSELSAKLSSNLMANLGSDAIVGAMSSDVCDFTAFLLPVKTAIIEEVGLGIPIAIPFCESVNDVPCYWEEIKFLHRIFIELLGKMEQCLQGMEGSLAVKRKETSEHLHIGWGQYFAILKELYSISTLYQGAEELYWTMLRHKKVSISYLIIKYAKRSDDNMWVREHKEIMNFEARRHLAMMLLPEVNDNYEELHEMLIDRSQLLPESFEYISRADPVALRSGLFMEFKHEEATGPGVLREWFLLVCQALFNPQNTLFAACPNDHRRFFPNPTSRVDPLHLQYFTFSGRVIALALMHKVHVGIALDRVFFLQLAGMNVCLEDIQDVDPYLYHSCKQILEMDPEIVDQDALGLTFAQEVEELGYVKLVELCSRGKNITVNCSNRREYVDLLIKHRFVTSIAKQVAHFSKGFADIISSSRLQKFFFKNLELEDLDRMLHGSECDISVEDWKAHTEYNGYKKCDRQIRWFWKVVREMSTQQRKVLLFFWTSVKYLPVVGFSGLASRLYIYRSSESYDHLPSSRTCFYRLSFPPYPSLAIMQDRLQIITKEHVGCSFGTW